MTNLTREQLVAERDTMIKLQSDSVSIVGKPLRRHMPVVITIAQRRIKVSIKMSPLLPWKAYTKTTEN